MVELVERSPKVLSQAPGGTKVPKFLLDTVGSSSCLQKHTQRGTAAAAAAAAG